MNKTFKRLRRNIRKLTRHKLLLNPQYAARPVYIPDRYYKNINLKNPPSISIVTPSFNHGKYIEETIKSIIDQRYPNLEYIIRDGGSTDHTTKILKKYESKTLEWSSGKDRGQAHAINVGLQSSKGEIMAYLNSDDILLPGSLNFVAKYFETHPSVDVVYGHRVLIDGDSREIGRWIIPPHSDIVLSLADYVPQETLFWRRSIWEKAGGHIDETFDFAMDWELLFRFMGKGAKFKRLPRFLGAYRVQEQGKSTTVLHSTGEEEMSRLRLRHHKRALPHREIVKKLSAFYAHHALLETLYRLKILRY